MFSEHCCKRLHYLLVIGNYLKWSAVCIVVFLLSAGNFSDWLRTERCFTVFQRFYQHSYIQRQRQKWQNTYRCMLVILLTTRKVAWFIILVDSVCLSVCRTITFKALTEEVDSCIYQCISKEYGSSSYMKVIGSRSRSQEHKTSKTLALHWLPIPFVCARWCHTTCTHPVHNFQRYSPDGTTDHMSSVVPPYVARHAYLHV